MTRFNFPLFFRLLHHSFFRSRNTPGRLCPRRWGFLLGTVLFAYPLVEIVHRVAWLLDEVFYRRYRQEAVEAPVFIVAPHRSATTLLFETLARDPQFSALKLWESALAPAVVERKAVWALLTLDRRIGAPLRRLLDMMGRRMASAPQAQALYRAHRPRLTGVEEETMLFLHIAGSYDLLAFFPFVDALAEYADYHRRVPEARRRRDMAYYRSMIQRHHTAHPGRRHLAKVPTLAPAIPDVLSVFPDARFIHLVRHPYEVIPSAMTLWYGHWRMNGCPDHYRREARVIAEVYCLWYRRLHEDLAHLPPQRYIRVHYRALTADLGATVRRIYQQLDLPLSAEMAAYLDEQTPRARAYRPRNAYTLEQWGLRREEIAEMCREVGKMYGFAL